MKAENKSKLGWLVAAVLVAGLIGSGFGQAEAKMGVVDMDKVVFDSQLGKNNAAKLDTAVKSRQGLIDMVGTYRIATEEQLQRLRALVTKPTMSDAEKTEYDKIVADIKAAANQFDQLNQKTQPSEDDRRLLQEYNTRRDRSGQALQQWNQQFQEELVTMREQMLADSVKRAREVISERAKAQGYTVVFTSSTAVYAANDITADVIKALDSKP